MAGCLRRVGCLTLLVVAAALYFVRDEWLPAFRDLTGLGGDDVAAVADGVWQPLSPDGAARARARVQSLGTRRGPVYTTVSAPDLASYVYDELRRQLPPSAENVEAAVIGDQLHVRALVDMSDLGGTRVLGPLAQFLADRDTVQFGGTFQVVRPGLAQFRVRQIKLRQLSIPAPLIPQILGRLNRGVRLEGVAADALPLQVPAYVADVRVGQGRVTLYKAVP